MWIYANQIYDKLSTIRKVNRLSTTSIKWLRKNNYIKEITEDQITPDSKIITIKEREPYNYEPEESSF